MEEPMNTVSTVWRTAFTCGFGPGHHPHPVHTLALAQQPPEVVRIADIDDGVVTLIHEGGGVSHRWNHGGIEGALIHSDGVAFLHAGAVLRVGGRLFSMSDEPTPCTDALAHRDPAHPAWAGPSTDETPHERPLRARSPPPVLAPRGGPRPGARTRGRAPGHRSR
jgi:hypothetical protein